MSRLGCPYGPGVDSWRINDLWLSIEIFSNVLLCIKNYCQLFLTLFFVYFASTLLRKWEVRHHLLGLTLVVLWMMDLSHQLRLYRDKQTGEAKFFS